ncbi:MAG: transposase [Patescibacteria group bacterium]
MVQYYHLYNRGVDKRVIFLDDTDRQRFLDAVRLARLSNSPRLSWLKRQIKIGNISPTHLEKLEEKYGPPLLDIVTYSLMPNHFHFQVKELIEDGVSQFFRKLGTSYVMYFNIKHERTGRLFESQYRSVLIGTDEQLIHLSRYIHTNPYNSSKRDISLEQLKTYSWTSLPDYLGTRKQPFCDPTEVMSFFNSPEDYWEFLKGNIDKEEVLPPELLLDPG